MRDHIESQYSATFSQWAEWDGECERYAVYMNGELILADSLALLLSELQGRTHIPLLLAA